MSTTTFEKSRLPMTTSVPTPEYLPIAEIRIDGGTQSRVKLNWDVIAEYAEAIELNAIFPPILVFYDGKNYWLADGFHRLYATKKAGRQVIALEVRQGSHRDALLYSVGANANHGLRRTNADKRRAVEIMLRDEEWSRWSNREIAKRCEVSEFMVRQMRESICDKNADSCKRIAQRQGKTYTLDTANIGEGTTSAQIPESPKLYGEDERGRVLMPTGNPQQIQRERSDSSAGVLINDQTLSFQEPDEVQLFDEQSVTDLHPQPEDEFHSAPTRETSKPQDIVNNIAMQIMHLSPTQLSRVICVCASNGLSEFHFKAISKAVKHALAKLETK